MGLQAVALGRMSCTERSPPGSTGAHHHPRTHRMGTRSAFSQRYMKKAKRNRGSRTMACEMLIHMKPECRPR